MTEGPNITYQKIDKYVSISSSKNTSGLMLKADYETIAEALQGAGSNTKKILDEIAAYEKMPAQKSKFLQHPWSLLSAQQKESFCHDLKGKCPADREVLDVWQDTRQNKTGYNTPVYSVNGQAVRGDLFDKDGILSDHVAKIYGVSKQPTPVKPAASKPKPF